MSRDHLSIVPPLGTSVLRSYPDGDVHVRIRWDDGLLMQLAVGGCWYEVHSLEQLSALAYRASREAERR